MDARESGQESKTDAQQINFMSIAAASSLSPLTFSILRVSIFYIVFTRGAFYCGAAQRHGHSFTLLFLRKPETNERGSNKSSTVKKIVLCESSAKVRQVKSAPQVGKKESFGSIRSQRICH